MLNPLMYTLYTHDCTPAHHDDVIVKFADDATVVGLISKGDECAYRDEVERRGAWCSENNLLPNTSKARAGVWLQEEKKADISPLVGDDVVEQVSNFLFVGAHIDGGLTWIRLQLGGAEKSPAETLLPEGERETTLLVSFSRCSTESVLTYRLCVCVCGSPAAEGH